MHIEIYSPAKILFKGEAGEVLIPSVNGEVGILPQHARYITLLGEGRIAVSGISPQEWIVKSGLASVENDVVKILVDDVA